jgi:two-component system, NarL family, nitrate/nitrite response regulator NarL
MAERIRLIVIDSAPLVREGFRSLLAESAEFLVAATGGNLHDAIALTQTYSPEVVVMDINIPGNGLEAAKLLARSYPKVRIVILTFSERPEHVKLALQIGVIGYVLKGSTVEELYSCLRAIRGGKRYISPELAGAVLGSSMGLQDAAGPLLSLDQAVFTARENEVVSLLGMGKTNKEIALQLELSEKTVKHHMSTIMEKLQVRNRVEAALAVSRMSNR